MHQINSIKINVPKIIGICPVKKSGNCFEVMEIFECQSIKYSIHITAQYGNDGEHLSFVCHVKATHYGDDITISNLTNLRQYFEEVIQDKFNETKK
ncbi:MAG: hypothetical protein V1783_04325 [Bacteroidota bacterium]